MQSNGKKGNFYDKVYEIARNIPQGKVTTYGHIALLAGRPNQARAVGYALSLLPAETNVPWQRIINRLGQISIKSNTFSRELQRKLLEEEGVVFDKDSVDLDKYGWFISV